MKIEIIKGNHNAVTKFFSKTRGGKREGSGRKKGSGKGKQNISKSISASESFWQKIDLVRGEKSRSKHIVDELNKGYKMLDALNAVCDYWTEDCLLSRQCRDAIKYQN
jgi:hypothetical protein